MTRSILILLGMAFALCVASLTFAACAQCTSCVREGNWEETSARNFIEGKPIDDTPILFGPKAERQKNSQLNSKSGSTEEAVDKNTPTASIETPRVGIDLLSFNATPNPVNSGNQVEIKAILAQNSSSQSKNPGEAGNDSEDKDETLFTASASIKDDSGLDAGKINLMRISENEYSGTWKAVVPAGLYKVTLTASSLEASKTFQDALQIEVIDANNMTDSASDL